MHSLGQTETQALQPVQLLIDANNILDLFFFFLIYNRQNESPTFKNKGIINKIKRTLKWNNIYYKYFTNLIIQNSLYKKYKCLV